MLELAKDGPTMAVSTPAVEESLLVFEKYDILGISALDGTNEERRQAVISAKLRNAELKCRAHRVMHSAHRSWLRGDLNLRPKSLILLRHDSTPKTKPQQLLEVAGVLGLGLVAGAGFEPTTAG